MEAAKALRLLGGFERRATYLSSLSPGALTPTSSRASTKWSREPRCCRRRFGGTALPTPCRRSRHSSELRLWSGLTHENLSRLQWRWCDDERQCPTCGGLGFVPDNDDDHVEIIKTSRRAQDGSATRASSRQGG